MNKDNKTRERKYPFNMSRVYLNAATAALSIFMAFVLLGGPLLLTCFLILTSSITMIAFVLKIRPVFKIPRPSEDQQGDVGKVLSRRRFFMLLIVIVAVVLTPFLLFLSAGIFPADSWFIIIASLASGIGISEILFYIYCEKAVRQNG